MVGDGNGCGEGGGVSTGGGFQKSLRNVSNSAFQTFLLKSLILDDIFSESQRTCTMSEWRLR